MGGFYVVKYAIPDYDKYLDKAQGEYRYKQLGQVTNKDLLSYQEH